jgi:hypothetical protein
LMNHIFLRGGIHTGLPLQLFSGVYLSAISCW